MSEKTLQKQPREEIFYDMRFSNILSPTETITNISLLEGTIVSSTNQSPQDITIASSSIFSNYIRFKLSGGTDGTFYKITALIDTDSLNKFEGDGLLEVKNF